MIQSKINNLRRNGSGQQTMARGFGGAEPGLLKPHSGLVFQHPPDEFGITEA